MRRLAAWLVALVPFAAFPASPPSDDDTCTIDLDADDLFAQDRDLVVPAGRRFADAVVIRGDAVVRAGAHVKQVIALGGDVVVEDGANVEEDAIAIGGDVRVHRGAHVGSDAISIGGAVDAARERIAGEVVALSFDWGGTSLEEAIVKELNARGRCTVRRDR
ncbi:MAG TPA: hypothetical protein VD838_22635 [Anaeromyxobacteraceae bacterium]|nr:hypothetical protein [Anaeromyxobacteraceae bacterium]